MSHETPPLSLTVNGESRRFTDPQTVASLLRELEMEKKPCAVEVNGKLVPKREHEAHQLHSDDTLEIVTLVGGG
ncbi:MAG: sulfur carrier protein ThiS [Phycisphaerales bacterium]|nr:MAG: sulfur carrier protein ThiS [Phycisphaerales bacterium]